MDKKLLSSNFIILEFCYMVFMPFLFSICIDNLLRSIFDIDAYIPYWNIFIIIILMIFKFGIDRFSRNEKLKLVVRIRNNSYVIILFVLINYIFFSKTFYLIFYNFLLLSINLLINNLLKLENYESILKNYGKCRNLKELKKTSQAILISSYNDLFKIKNALTYMQVVFIFIMLFFGTFFGFAYLLNFMTYLFIFIYLFLTYIFSGLINILISNQMLTAKGLLINFSKNLKRFYSLLLVIITGFSLSFLISSNFSLLKVAWFKTFFDWLGKFFSMKTPYDIPANKKPGYSSLLEDLNRMLANFNVPVIFDLRLVLNILSAIILAGIIIGFLIMLLMPFIRNNILSKIKGLNLIKLLLDKLKLILFLFFKLFKSIKKSIRNLLKQKPQANLYKKDMVKISMLEKIKNTVKKKRELKKIVKAFIKIINWAEKKGIRYCKNKTTREFLVEIKDKIVFSAKLTNFICETFEESIFSLHILEKEKVSSYFRTINELLKI